MEEKSLKVLGDNIVYCIDYITGIKILTITITNYHYHYH